MVGEALTALSAFKTMFDLAKGMKDINDATVRNDIAIELQEKILAAQAQQATLIETVTALENELAKLRAWDADKKRYELREIASGQFAYALKRDTEMGETPHTLCANCFSEGRKSLLQTEIRFPGRHTVFFCQRCDSEMYSPDTGGRDANVSTPRRRR